MLPDLAGSLMYLARFVLNPVLFAIAGVVLVVARPAWHGPWWLLVGAVVSVGVVVMRLLRLMPPDASAEAWLLYEATESLAFVAVGVGVLLTALRARRA